MGCNESKQDVATGNTITRKKSDASSMKSIETINETGPKDVNPSLLAQQEESQNVSNDSGGDHAAGAASADAKDTTDENKEFKANKEEKETDEKEGVAGEEEPGKLISKESPNRFFSSRKEEDTEVVSEKSEYFSPHIEHEETGGVQPNGAVEKTQAEETEQGTENGGNESAIVKEEKQQQNPQEDKLAVTSTNGPNAA